MRLKRNGRRPQSELLVIATAVALATALQGPSAFALTFPSRGPLRGLPVSSRQVMLTPFGSKTMAKPQGFALFDSGQMTFNEAVRSLLRDNLQSPVVEVRATDTTQAFALATGSTSTDYRFFVGGVPLCGFQMRAHQLSDRSPLILGTLPEIDPYETPPTDWPDQDLAAQKAADGVHALSGAKTIRVATSSRCVYVSDGHLMPVYNFTVYGDELPYTAMADAYEAIKVQQSFFDVDGTGKAYDSNKITGTAKEAPLHDLTADNTLTSTYLQTIVPAKYQQAKGTNEVFDFDESDARFDEVQAYVHAQTHFDWFTSLGFQWYGPQPLQVKIHVPPQGRPNNALFTPGGSDGTLPSIQIDDGDGVDLQNLVTDGDVVSHEFGHHVIYKTLRSTDGESLVLHEGLADSFVFFRTGDPCLGESICPKGSGACVLEAQCLRTAANTLSYDDDLWQQWAGPNNRLGHLHGQLISGLLWDLRKNGDLPADDVTHLAFKTISFLKEDSGFCDFVADLFGADKDLFGGKYADKLRAAVNNRGMQQFLPDAQPACTTVHSSNIQDPYQPSPSGSKKDKKGNDNPFSCGTIAFAQGQVSAFWLLLLISLPLLVAARPAPARASARQRRKTDKT